MTIYTPTKTYHKHHIIPRHAGGTNNPSNIIELTIEEHAKAHKLLYEKYGHEHDKIAWKALSGQIGKEEIQIQLSRLGGMKGGGKNKGKKRPLFTPEHKQKLSDAKKGKKHTPETIKKMSDAKAKDYIITDPQGNEFRIINLYKFCRENGLSQGSLAMVVIGRRKHHKGYKVRYA